MKKRTKILFCIDTLSGGGAEKVLIDILNQIDNSKYDINLLVLENFGVYFTKIPSYVNCIASDDMNHDTMGYDVGVAFLEGSATKYISQKTNILRKIAWVHTDLFNNHWSHVFFRNKEEEKECYNNMDKIVFVSEMAQMMFNQLFENINVAKQKVIYNLIDKENINNKKVPVIAKQRQVLCTVGRLIPQKGYFRLIPILYKLLKEDKLDFDFWFVGDGFQKEELQNLAISYGIEKSITFWGFRQNPYPYMNTADIFVSSSFVEGFSIVIAEALCLGKPIIATAVTGSTELLDNGKYGLLVEPDDESLYRGLKKIIIDKYLREELSDKAKIRSQIFNKETTMKEIYSIF